MSAVTADRMVILAVIQNLGNYGATMRAGRVGSEYGDSGLEGERRQGAPPGTGWEVDQLQ